MYCRYCGKQIDPDANYCIHCGAAQTDARPSYDQRPAAENPKRTNGFGIAGFVLAIVTISTWYLNFFGIVPLVALVLSCVGMYRRRYCNYANRLTVAGLVLSIISVAISLLYTAGYLNILSGA